MTPAAYMRRSYPFASEPFDYLAMEVTSSWLTVRTIARRISRGTPKPFARAFVKTTNLLHDWAGGSQNVWVKRSPGLKARTVRLIRASMARIIKPRSFATPDEFETFVLNMIEVCRANNAGLVVLFAGVRSSDRRHKWAVDLVNDLEARLRRLQSEHGLAVVNMVPHLSLYPNPELMADGLHPNREGHIRMASEVVGAINEMDKGRRSFWRDLDVNARDVGPAEGWSLPDEPVRRGALVATAR
ncbi:MAG: SGNH/GDSL hydrolase family protein [Dehalococcoidia bacterium]